MQARNKKGLIFRREEAKLLFRSPRERNPPCPIFEYLVLEIGSTPRLSRWNPPLSAAKSEPAMSSISGQSRNQLALSEEPILGFVSRHPDFCRRVPATTRPGGGGVAERCLLSFRGSGAPPLRRRLEIASAKNVGTIIRDFFRVRLLRSEADVAWLYRRKLIQWDSGPTPALRGLKKDFF